MRSRDEVLCNGEIVCQKVDRKPIVRQNASDSRCGDDHDIGFALVEVALGRVLTGKIEFASVDGQDRALFAAQTAHQSGAQNAAMACNKDARPLQAEQRSSRDWHMAHDLTLVTFAKSFP